jgi:CheY-like chemotaxis protein
MESLMSSSNPPSDIDPRISAALKAPTMELDRLRVLVADDEPMLRSVIVEFIDLLDFCSHAEVNDGLEALEYVRSHPVDCILSDVRMPQMNLEELLGIVSREFPDVVVIATSGYSDIDTSRKILRSGAHDFIAKPLDLDTLEQALVWIAVRRRLLEAARALFHEPPSSAPDNWADRIEIVSTLLSRDAGLFESRMNHARRTAELAALTARDLAEPQRRELQLAALLHEIGVSSYHLQTHSQTKPFGPDELELLHYQAAMADRLIRRALPDRITGSIVRRHVHWRSAEIRGRGDEEVPARLPCWLGVLNVVDALFSDRADRPGYPAERAREIVQELLQETEADPLQRTLELWPEIERFYGTAE